MLDKPSSGYAHELYAESFCEVGKPLKLKNCGGWLVERRISSGNGSDAVGCYPFFSCRDWGELSGDIKEITNGSLVSVTFVTDPFCSLGITELSAIFPDKCEQYKTHFIIDLQNSPNLTVSKHHRYYLRRSMSELCVEWLSDSEQYTDEWASFYASLIEKKHISGIASFSSQSLRAQLRVPSATLFRAYDSDGTVGYSVWIRDGDRAHYHLSAANSRGYKHGASYLLMHAAIEHFRAVGVHLLGLGGVPDSVDDSNLGLHRFKGGWANKTLPVYLCGKILDRARYQELSRQRGTTHVNYFPSYRLEV